MIAPLIQLPIVRYATAAAILSLLAVAAFFEAPTRMRPWMPRFRDAAIHCEGRHCDVDRVRVRTLLETSAGVSSAARIVPSVHCGQLVGFRLYAVRPGSLLARLGLRNGDKILSFNGRQLSTPDTAMTLYQSLRSARFVALEIERGRVPMTLTYTIH